MTRIVLVAAVFVIALSGCTLTTSKSAPVPNAEPSTCSADADCAVGGCSNHVCGKKGEVEDVVTTCEYKDEYACLRLTNCACVNEKCQWRQTIPYQTCVNRI